MRFLNHGYERPGEFAHKATFVWREAVCHLFDDVPDEAKVRHGFRPPAGTKAGLEKGAASAFFSASNCPFRDPVCLRSVRPGAIFGHMENLASLAYLFGIVRVNVLCLKLRAKEPLKGFCSVFCNLSLGRVTLQPMRVSVLNDETHGISVP